MSICDGIDIDADIRVMDNKTGCNSTDEIDEICKLNTTNIYNGDEVQTLIVNPNPAYDILSIDTNIGVLYAIDMLGHMTELKLFHREADVSSLTPGLYVLIALDHDTTYRTKIIKQ